MIVCMCMCVCVHACVCEYGCAAEVLVGSVGAVPVGGHQQEGQVHSLCTSAAQHAHIQIHRLCIHSHRVHRLHRYTYHSAVSVPLQRNMRTYIYTDYAYIHTEYTDYTDKHITMRTYIHIGDTYTQTSHA